MEALRRLIGELRAGGELDSRGEFTLDRDRAREKMRQFQLTDPRSYVLELVQAAVLAGAGEVRFEIDADDMRMSFDGRPFTTLDFEELYSSMFTRRRSPARRRLALGLNSAMALDPRILRVESGTALMEMRPGGDEITMAKEAVDGTRIHVKDRFGNATLVRFVLKLRGHITEMLYLKEHCRYAALPIHLNGEPISGVEPLAEAAGRIELATPDASIVAGFAHLRPARLMILDQGVWIATHLLDDLPQRFVACVECPRLRKDASQRDVVRDEAYDGILEAVSAAFHRALADLGARARESPAEKALFRRLLLHPATLPLIQRVLDALLDSEAETPEGGAVAAVPLWASARYPPLELSLLDLLHARAARGRVGWARDVYPDLERRSETPVAVIPSTLERSYLAELFGDGFYPAESELQRELVQRRKILRWQQDHSGSYDEAAFALHMNQEPLAPRSTGVEEVVIEAGGLRGRIGLLGPEPPGRPVHARLQLLKYDRRLDEIRYRLPIGPIDGMINDDQLTPTPDWGGARRYGAVKRIRSLVLERAVRFLVALCDSHGATTDRLPEGYLRWLLLDAATRVLATEATLRDWVAEDLLPPEVTEQDWAVELIAALETVPLFANLDGRGVDLRSIRQDLDRHDTLLYLPEHRSALGASPQEMLELTGRPVLQLSRDDRDALGRIYGSYRLQDVRQWLLAGRWGPELAATEPAGRVALDADEALVKIALTGEGLGGEVALSREPGEPGLEIDLYQDGRFRGTSKTATPHALLAVACDDRLELDERGHLDPNGKRPAELARLCLEHLPLLIAELVAREEPWQAPRRDAAFHHLVSYLAAETARVGERDEVEQGIFQAASELPVFRGVDRPYSYADLRRSYEIFGSQAVLRWPAGGTPADSRRCVLVALPPERPLLELLFPEIEDVDEQWRQEQVQRQQQAISPSSPGGPSEPAPAARTTPAWDRLPPGEARLLGALHAELRRAGRGHAQLLDEKNLDRIVLGGLPGDVIASCRGRGVTVHRHHPLVERLLAEPETDQVQLAFLASAVYTAMNHFWREIEDDHEREFHRALIKGLSGERPRSGDARA